MNLLNAELENEYQKKEHLQHIYDLPDTYTGSIEFTDQDMFIINDSTLKMESTRISYVPGLFKIFDEILVNALDHRQRDPNVKNIKVHFGIGFSEISVWNDGKGIDVEKHPVYNDYIVEMLFGQLLTSSNYVTDQKRVTGGKNGYGAKLTNIFSKKFKIETVDAVRKKKYIQVFENNMRTKNEPIITHCASKPYTMITFLPDYLKFECNEGITNDIYKLFEKRIYDLSGICQEDMTIYLNNEKIKVRGFDKYINLYLPDSLSIFYMDDKQERWKVGIALSPNSEYNEVSFVNGIWTMKGGKHTENVLGQILDKLKDMLAKNPKTRTKNVKNAVIKEQIWLFVNCIIENPSFTSQTKEEMSSKVSHFGSKWECCDKMIEKFYKSGFLDRILETCVEQEEKNMKKTDGNKKSQIRVPKLEDANYAGTRKSHECTLILTEGDSAKTSALSGLSIQGPSFRDYYGVFPLKGKFLNVRDASASQILNNEEVKNLKKILGLQQGKEYTLENIKELRYGSVSLMTDQDSVTGDTPILVSSSILIDQQNISILYIQDIFDDSCYTSMPNGKQVFVLEKDLYSWTSDGWTKIIKVIRHKTCKKLYRVVTNKGIVDVTEDHSLLDENGSKIRPCEINKDTNLLYSFPFYLSDNKLNTKYNQDDAADENMFIDNIGTKFYEYNKYNAQMKYLLEVIKGNKVNLEFDNDTECYIIHSMKENSFQCQSNNINMKCRVIQIIELPDSDLFVYDLETENHQFQAGVGELIVHNTDGSHIKGLLLNFFHHFFPSLLKIDGFLKTYITPIVRGFKPNNESLNFYTIADYENFKNSESANGYSFKYYKGLGTSSTKEMQEYFKSMNDITINYEYVKDADFDINMAFRKSMSQERKEWLKTYNPNETIIYSCAKKHKVLPLNDFIHKDLKHFSNADNIRSIPNIVDGLKPSQRKVLYGTLLKCGSTNQSIKVAQLSGFISEKTCYHHGEMSLEQTIISMAQKFVGKNNLNWFEPLGMFGTRLAGGKDHASSRYIFTKMNAITYKTFRKEDDPLLNYLYDDGDMIEPEKYYPIVPVILINGSEGIGTGYSTSIPCFNPIQIANECIKYAKGENICDDWTPWYNGFKGVIHRKNIQFDNLVSEQNYGGVFENTEDTSISSQLSTNQSGEGQSNVSNNMNSYVSEGIFTVNLTEKKIIVTELPVGVWTESYKEFLEEQLALYSEYKKKSSVNTSKLSEEKMKSTTPRFPVVQYINRCTDKDIYFEIIYETDKHFFEVEPSNFNAYCLVKLKLYSKINISNMYAYTDNELVKYNSVRQIMEYFCRIRLEKYNERKKIILDELKNNVLYLNEKIRFLEMVISGKLVVFKKPKHVLFDEMKSHQFHLKDDSFDYCVKMAIDSFTIEKITELKKSVADINAKIMNLSNKTSNEIWIEELEDWINEIKYILEKECMEAEGDSSVSKCGSSKSKLKSDCNGKSKSGSSKSKSGGAK